MVSPLTIAAVLRWGVEMAIDHEAHKIRIKAVSDRMNHPMTYNDAGAPKMSSDERYHEAYRKDYKSMEKARKGAGRWNSKEDAKILDKAVSKISR